ncbi:MAG: hypothetical protein ABGZ17_29975, partial [Planctomycetaceae bacterium]
MKIGGMAITAWHPNLFPMFCKSKSLPGCLGPTLATTTPRPTVNSTNGRVRSRRSEFESLSRAQEMPVAVHHILDDGSRQRLLAHLDATHCSV